jgi:predicted transcriptional regulator
MTKNELNALLKQYGITKKEFAKYLGIKRTSLYERLKTDNLPDYWRDNIVAIFYRKQGVDIREMSMYSFLKKEIDAEWNE